MHRRFNDDRRTKWSMVAAKEDSPLLVVCPQCQKKAIVLHRNSIAIASCIFCGFSKKKSMDTRIYDWYDANPKDGVFGYHLWLYVDCLGNSLWAYSEEHLYFLEKYVGAVLRQRRQDEYGWANASLSSRLPLWIKRSKNRAKLLKCLKALRGKLDE